MGFKQLMDSNWLWLSTQTRHIAKAVRDMGHEIAVLGFWGLEGGQLDYEGVHHFGKHLDGYGNDAVPYLVKRFKADTIITLIDLWVMNPSHGHLGAKWCPLFPLDHQPIPAVVAERFPHCHKLLVYSRFAENLVKDHDGGRYADKVVYLPHGVDCSAYRPADDGERVAIRKKLFPDWPEDAYVVGMVAANKGWPARKNLLEVMEAFASFHDRHANARLYMHSHPGQEFGGPPLMEFARMFGIAEFSRFLNPAMMFAGDYGDELMREIYCSMDVLLGPSMGEGFGLPILEAQSCGVPVVVTAFSSMTELMGDGWMVKPARLQPTLLQSYMAEVHPEDIAFALEQAYNRPKNWGFVEAARAKALEYDWPPVLLNYWKPFLDSLDAGRREMALELQA